MDIRRVLQLISSCKTLNKCTFCIILIFFNWWCSFWEVQIKKIEAQYKNFQTYRFSSLNVAGRHSLNNRIIRKIRNTLRSNSKIEFLSIRNFSKLAFFLNYFLLLIYEIGKFIKIKKKTDLFYQILILHLYYISQPPYSAPLIYARKEKKPLTSFYSVLFFFFILNFKF